MIDSHGRAARLMYGRRRLTPSARKKLMKDVQRRSGECVCRVAGVRRLQVPERSAAADSWFAGGAKQCPLMRDADADAASLLRSAGLRSQADKIPQLVHNRFVNRKRTRVQKAGRTCTCSGSVRRVAGPLRTAKVRAERRRQ